MLSSSLKLALLGALIGSNGNASPDPLFRQSDVFRAGEDHVNVYRIPAVITSQKGTLLAFCEARDAGDQSPTDMVLKRSFDQGATWQPMQIVVDGQDQQALMNPCPVVDRKDGTIFLFCNMFPDGKCQYEPGKVRQWVLKSQDDGATWSCPQDISEDISDTQTWASLCCGPGVAIQMRSGRIVVPLWYWAGGARYDFRNTVFYTQNHGKTWKQGGQVPAYADENQVIELADGHLLMNARITRDVPEKHRRKISVSQDKGRTWSEPFMDQALISPCCQASLLRYSFEEDKSRILFSHPGSDADRVNMTIRLSYDEAKTWPVAKAVNEGPAAYSCLTVMPDGTMGVLYETGEKQAYEKIAFARFNLEWLTEGRDHED